MENIRHTKEISKGEFQPKIRNSTKNKKIKSKSRSRSPFNKAYNGMLYLLEYI